MHPQIEALLNEAEIRYLKSEELNLLTQYVSSLSIRLMLYHTLRDKELEMMQRVADQLQAAMPNEKPEQIERSLKNAILLLRYCAMGMLLNDEAFVRDRLLDWLRGAMVAYNSQAIDTKLYQLLNQQLSQALTPQQISLLNPQLAPAQTTLVQQTQSPALI